MSVMHLVEHCFSSTSSQKNVPAYWNPIGGFSYEREEQHALKIHLLIYDRLDDPLRVPFFYNLKEPRHAYEALQLVEQGLLFFYLLTLQNDKLGFVERRSIYLPEDLKQELATVIKTILLEVRTAA